LIGIVASLGLVIIIEDYPIFLPTIKIIGGVYLFYIGVKTWLSHNGGESGLLLILEVRVGCC
jgi:threonine/homoserine/homoserine lactone efflux protein